MDIQCLSPGSQNHYKGYNYNLASVVPAESFTRWDVMWNQKTNVNPDEKMFETPRLQEFDNMIKVW